MPILNRIIDNQLCIGCGLCESLGREYGYTMELADNGFYNVAYPINRIPQFENQISRICPAVNPTATDTKEVWGHLEAAHYAWSNDPEIRERGSSGGLITGIAIYLLQKKMVDAVLHVGTYEDSPLHNELKISRTPESVLANASSRYAPATVFNHILQILNSTIETYCFIGKPCDVVAFKNMLHQYPAHNLRIKYFISLVCAGIPSYKGTTELLTKETGRKDLPHSIRYRGNGWPGYFLAVYPDGFIYKTSYPHSYGQYLKNFTHFRCKICPDGIGLSADTAVGDAWETIDGYPDFEERPGRSFVLSRTQKGERLLQQAYKDNTITIQPLQINKLANIQPYQYQRRLAVGYRLLLVHFFTGLLFNLNNLHLFTLMRKYPVPKGVRETLGALKRINQRNRF